MVACFLSLSRAAEAAAATVVGADIFIVRHRPKDKKLKKAKFKSLRHDGFSRDRSFSEQYLSHSDLNSQKGTNHEDTQSHLTLMHIRGPSQRKRKAPKLLEEELYGELEHRNLRQGSAAKICSLGSEKLKNKAGGTSYEEKCPLLSDELLPGPADSESVVLLGASDYVVSVGSKKRKVGAMVVRKGPLLMLEKERKKDSLKSYDQTATADSWMAAEDAVLCAVLHEYGGNWLLVSDALAGVPDGGVYRGRHRHPVHCRERFRQLLARSCAANGDLGNLKNNVQLKVTEVSSNSHVGT